MSAIAVIPQQAAAERPAYADVMRPKSLTEAMELADMLARSSFVPQQFRGSPGDVMAAIAYGAEVGLAPLAALQSVAVVNGKPCLYGDALLGVCQAAPGFESIEETIEGEGDHMTAVCIVRRRGMPPHEQRFSVADAKKAGLWGKKGPWQDYTKRMMTMRARGFALRNVFADALKGLISREEAEDYPTREPVRAEVVTSPQASTPAQSAVEATKAKLRAKKAEPESATLERVLAVIANAKTLNELDRGVAPLAKRLPDGDQQRARDAFRERKAQLRAEEEFANQEPPHDVDGVVLEDEPGADG